MERPADKKGVRESQVTKWMVEGFECLGAGLFGGAELDGMRAPMNQTKDGESNEELVETYKKFRSGRLLRCASGSSRPHVGVMIGPLRWV